MADLILSSTVISTEINMMLDEIGLLHHCRDVKYGLIAYSTFFALVGVSGSGDESSW